MLDPVLLVRAVLDAAFDIHLRAFAQVLASDFAGLAEQLHPVPFGLVLVIAVLVLARRTGGNRERGDRHSALGVLHFRVIAEIAYQDDLVDATRHGTAPSSIDVGCRLADISGVRWYQRGSGARVVASLERPPAPGRTFPMAGWESAGAVQACTRISAMWRWPHAHLRHPPRPPLVCHAQAHVTPLDFRPSPARRAAFVYFAVPA